jgi:DNA-binding winged helix-turn-helix (wHTH) protein
VCLLTEGLVNSIIWDTRREFMDLPKENGHFIQFGPFEVDLKNDELHRKGIRTHIQPAAFRLLEMLISRPNELIPRKEIRQVLWPQDKASTAESLDLRLNFEIKAVRKALNDNHVNPRYIQTVRKHGYKFIAPVKVIERNGHRDFQQNQDDPLPPATAKEAGNGKRQRKLITPKVLVTGITILIAGVGILVFRYLAFNRPVITLVTPILPQPNQTIVIQGRGLGSYTNFTALDTPYLAIRDQTAHWAAGRIMDRNWDETTLSVARWLNSEIIITGFYGTYGQNGWKLSPGDKIEVAVWNPQTGAGPALFHLKVSPETGQ